jgi:hypothetical protein
MQISIPSLGVGKSSCSVLEVDDSGSVVVRRGMRRQTLIELFSVATGLRHRVSSCRRMPCGQCKAIRQTQAVRAVFCRSEQRTYSLSNKSSDGIRTLF